MPTVAVGLSTETDSAFAVTACCTVQVGQALETDSAFAVTSVSKVPAVGLATELDAAFGVSYSRGAAADLVEVTYGQDERGASELWRYRVSGLASADLSRRPEEAANTTGWMQGDPHPTIAGIQVIRRSAELQDDASGYAQAARAEVVIEFAKATADAVRDGGPTGLGLLESNLETFTERVYESRSGEKLNAIYFTGASTLRQRFSADRQGSALTYILSKSFPAPRYQDNAIKGTVNAAPFGPAATNALLYRGVTFSQESDGNVIHRYQFSESPTLWRFPAQIIVGGLLPSDASEGNGYTTYDVQAETDFAAVLPVRFP